MKKKPLELSGLYPMGRHVDTYDRLSMQKINLHSFNIKSNTALGLKIIFAVCLAFFLTGCKKKDIRDLSYPGYEKGQVLMVEAMDDRSTFLIQQVDEPWILGFGASWGGLKSPDHDIPVEFALKQDWITKYNQDHNTTYEPLPEGSYTISGFSSVITKGTTTSQPLRITIQSKLLERGKKYMFPITLVSASNEQINTDLQTAWFKIDNVTRKETDVTSRGALTVSDENTSNANENSSKLVDGNIDTKFLTFNYTPNFWMQLYFPSPEIIGAYTLTSGNDAEDRDPKNWTLVGSNDGTTWTVLDTRTNISFASRKQTVMFDCNNEQPYKYYRMNITERFGGGNGLLQISEWRLISLK